MEYFILLPEMEIRNGIAGQGGHDFSRILFLPTPIPVRFVCKILISIKAVRVPTQVVRSAPSSAAITANNE